jgi:hypothetical protein
MTKRRLLMNRIIMMIMVALVLPMLLLAQISWTEHPVDTTCDGASSVYAIDLDGDLDIDVLGAAQLADDITWWENADGTGTTWIKHTIADNFDGAHSVYAIDLDSDLDIDVMGAAYDADDITWWENADGTGTTWVEHTIEGDLNAATSVYAIDLDKDGDNDVLGAAYYGYGHYVTWWENADDTGMTWIEHTIADNYSGAWSVYAEDVDGDSDVDVLSASYSADDISWWENVDDTGTTWIRHRIAPGNFNGVRVIYAIDVDGDDDIDVLGAAYIADDIAWWENADDTGTTWIKHTIDSDFGSAWSVYGEDVDNDSDTDILGAAYADDAITWWENADDTGMTWIEHTIAIGFDAAHAVYAIDVDGDIDKDVLGAAYAGDDIIWWESDLAIKDASMLSIDIPPVIHADTIVHPQTTVANSSTNGETVTFDVTCTIEPGGYTSTYAVTELAPGEYTQITFDSTFTFASGTYTITAYTQFEGDENSANDTLTLGVEALIYYDVGTVSIDVPSSVSEDTELNPHATITNGGINTETFNVTCTIEPGEYTSTTVSNTAPGESLQITFPDEFIFASGVYTVTVYTRLGSDENPANDTLEKMIETYDPGIAEGSSNIPLSFAFGLKNNPARGKALFNLALPEAGAVTLTIYDISGRVVDNVLCGTKPAGYYEVPWNSKMASGIYFYKFVSPWKNEVGKLVLVR